MKMLSRNTDSTIQDTQTYITINISDSVSYQTFLIKVKRKTVQMWNEKVTLEKTKQKKKKKGLRH